MTTCNITKSSTRKLGREKSQFKVPAPKPYTPRIYPGRLRWGEIHVFDSRGKLIADDVFPGIGHLDGIGIDRNDNIYVMVGATRVMNGKKFSQEKNAHNVTETLIKVKPRKAKVVSTSSRVPVVLSKEAQPKRSPDITGKLGAGGWAWVEGAE